MLVVIPCAGLGTRLRDILGSIPKPLACISGKATLTRIIELYPKDTKFIILVGYKENDIRTYLELAHGNSDITCISVIDYQGPTAGPLMSISCAERLLQQPFIFHAGDTLPIGYNPENLKGNSILVGPTTNSIQYAKDIIEDNKVTHILNKGNTETAKTHLGIVRIEDTNVFWVCTHALLALKESDMSDVHIINKMLETNKDIYFNAEEVEDWIDAGSQEGLIKRCKLYNSGDQNLPKKDQAAYVLDDIVIKYHKSTEVISKMKIRADALKDTVPHIILSQNSWLAYTKAQGRLMREVVTPNLTKKFLQWCDNKLWKPVNVDISDLCDTFYKQKTLKRIEAFRNKTGILDCGCRINEVNIPTTDEMLNILDWNLVCNGVPTNLFHGDLHFSNIIVDTNNNFTLIDWRDDFGNNTDIGDIYYDLAKLHAGMLLSLDKIIDGKYTIILNGTQEPERADVTISLDRNTNAFKSIDELKAYINTKGYSWWKVEALTALIYLNMSPLHHYPLNLLLYYYGNYMLNNCIQTKEGKE